jgi:hypothetical protein
MAYISAADGQTEPNTEHYAAGLQGKTPARGTTYRIPDIGT